MIDQYRNSALRAYYWATLPLRQRDALARAAQATEPVQVLFYHRVADEFPNDWTIDTRSFARQIEWIRERFDIVSLAEAQRRIAQGHNRRPTVAITFDDGYAENSTFAVPFLIRNALPFTYFVATRHVLESRPFTHDLKAGHRLRPNTLAELEAMVDAGVEIGSHTRNHADLGQTLIAEQLRDELAGSKYDLEQALDVEVRYFAFPFGLPENMSREAFRAAAECGYYGVCSAYGAYNLPGDDPFHIRRIHADPEIVRLRNWLTIDPRKLNLPPAFDPGDYDVESAVSAGLGGGRG